MAGASPHLFTWWVIVGVLQMLLPTVFAMLVGVAAAEFPLEGLRHPAVGGALLAALLSQVVPPIQTAISQNLGALTGARLTERLVDVSVRPTGVSHLENAELADDLDIVREFDYGVTGLPMYMSVEFITAALTPFLAGVVAAVALLWYEPWVAIALVLGWSFTHFALRRSAAWAGRHSQDANDARRSSQYYFDLAVQPRDSKEVRLFGLAPWIVGRFERARRALLDLQFEDMRISKTWIVAATIALLVVNGLALGSIGWRALEGQPIHETVTVVQLALAVQAIAFGSLSWVLDDGSAPVLALARIESATQSIRRGLGAEVRPPRSRSSAARGVAVEVDDVSFAYPSSSQPVLKNISLAIRPGEAIAIVGDNGAGKSTLAALICDLYQPSAGEIRADGRSLRDIGADVWRSQLSAVFQDVLKLHLTVRENVDPEGRFTDHEILEVLQQVGLSSLHASAVLGSTQAGGRDLSGGQWQRIALARSILAVRGGARLVLLDEPTASLDIRGELETFRDYLEFTRGATRILISHRFSTVRMVDRIAVIESGSVVELGSHEELMLQNGRYARMYSLQSSVFKDGPS